MARHLLQKHHVHELLLNELGNLPLFLQKFFVLLEVAVQEHPHRVLLLNEFAHSLHRLRVVELLEEVVVAVGFVTDCFDEDVLGLIHHEDRGRDVVVELVAALLLQALQYLLETKLLQELVFSFHEDELTERRVLLGLKI